MASLWNFYDGEPFLENPHLAVITNPRRGYGKRNPTRKLRKGKRNSMARKGRMPAGLRRYWAKHRRNRPRRRSRRNPIPIAGVLANPRHRRRSRRNPSVHRRMRAYFRRRGRKNPHRYRRNPSLVGGLPAMWTMAYATGGFMVLPVIESLLRKYIIPTSLQTMGTIGNFLIRVAALLGMNFVAKQVIKGGKSTMVLIGGAVYVIAQTVADAGFNLKTTLGLSGVGAYTGRPGLNAYVPGMAGTFQRRLAAPPYGARRPIGAASAPMGGMNIIPLRFRRNQ